MLVQEQEEMQGWWKGGGGYRSTCMWDSSAQCAPCPPTTHAPVSSMPGGL